MQPTRAATRCVRGWVGEALRLESGSGPGAGSAPVAADLEAGDLLAAVHRQRVVEIVHRHGEALGLPDAVAEPLGTLRDAARALVPLQLLELSRVGELLSGAGVRHLVFKGPALAAQTTGDVGGRGPGDLDLLVDPAVVERVALLLAAEGWVPVTPLPPPGSWAWRRIVHASHELGFTGAAGSVDLHWRLDPTLDALPSFGDLWSRRAPVRVGGVEVATLAPADALAHACLNAAKDEWRWLRNLVDVHRLGRLDGAWATLPSGRLPLHTLAVTRAHVGLPVGVPTAVLERVDELRPRTAARVVAAAERAQETPVRTLREGPGTATSQVLRYQLAASSSARDIRRVLGVMVLPGRAVHDVDSGSAWTGVPTGMTRRAGLLARRTLQRDARPDEPERVR